MSDFPSVSQRISDMFSSNLSVWPLTPSPQRGRKPETAVTLLSPPSLPHSYLCPACLDAHTPVLSLNSQVNKLHSLLQKNPSRPLQHLSTAEAQQGRNRAELIRHTKPTGSDLLSSLKKVKIPWWPGQLDSRLLCRSRRGSRGGEVVQVDVGGAVRGRERITQLIKKNWAEYRDNNCYLAEYFNFVREKHILNKYKLRDQLVIEMGRHKKTKLTGDTETEILLLCCVENRPHSLMR